MEDRREHPPSKSARKRAAGAVEELARKSLDLPPGILARLPLDQVVRSELEIARKVRGHSSRKRQIKHLASVLRVHDEERRLLQQVLEQETGERRQDACDFQRLEDLRERLCEPATFDHALEEAVHLMPALDCDEVRRLAEVWWTHADKSAFRALFRCLRDAQERGGIA